MYAFVRFLEDNVCYALPVSCVRDFSPRSRLDFDNQKVYAVYRGPEELGAGPEIPPRAPRDWGALLLHKAQILALAGRWSLPGVRRQGRYCQTLLGGSPSSQREDSTEMLTIEGSI
uniref:BEN domain containing 5 n=1 Tax=Equus asinus TaxID=9793 RepID=A0A9L0IBT8_EQUAS